MAALCLALIALSGAACGDDPAPTAGGSQDVADMVSDLGCAGCHSTNGDKKSGPTWQGLAGSDVPLADGSTVVADRAYLTRSIEDPGADVVDGFAPIMPDLNLDPEQIDAIVTYIQELER